MASEFSQKSIKSGNKSKSKKFRTISFNLRKEEAAAFQAYAKSQGKTVRGLLLEFIRACIKNYPSISTFQEQSVEQLSFDDFCESSDD